MKEVVIVTGHSIKELKKLKKKIKKCCYYCKKTEDDEVVYLLKDSMATKEVELVWVESDRGNVKFSYLVCTDCLRLHGEISVQFVDYVNTDNNRILN